MTLYNIHKHDPVTGTTELVDSFKELLNAEEELRQLRAESDGFEYTLDERETDPEISERLKVTITWVPEDIQTLRPEMSDEEAEDALADIGKYLQDRSTELGWQVMEDLLDFRGL